VRASIDKTVVAALMAGSALASVEQTGTLAAGQAPSVRASTGEIAAVVPLLEGESALASAEQTGTQLAATTL